MTGGQVSTSRDDEPQPAGRWAVAGGVFALVAVVLEVRGSLSIGGSASTASWLVVQGWPQWLRAIWWAVATAGVLAAQRGMGRALGRPRRIATAVAVAPFAVFTLGVALGASWATWH